MAAELLDIMPKILAQSLTVLREECILPQIVNSDYSRDAEQKGNIVHVPIPTRVPSQDVTPGATSGDTEQVEMNTTPIPLNHWREAPFTLTDKQAHEIDMGYVVTTVEEAARSLVSDINRSCTSLYKKAYWNYGTPGTTPFETNVKGATQSRKLLNKALARPSNRYMLLNVDAQAQAEELDAFNSVQNSGDPAVMREGQLGRKFGFNWFYDQEMPQHEAGTAVAAVSNITVKASPTSTQISDASDPMLHNPKTINQVVFEGVDTGGTLVAGDIFTVAGDDQPYVVVADVAEATGELSVIFNPAPVVLWEAGAVVTKLESHAVNLALHRDSIGLAIRSLNNNDQAFGRELGTAKEMTMVDPKTGIPLRLEVRQEFRQIRYALDILWGVSAVRESHIVRLMG